MIADLRELDRLTGGSGGARRVCWTDAWVAAREFLRALLADLPVDVSVDPAGNLWALRPGASGELVVVGSHIDSVPGGGWLDGALGVMAAVEVLRSLESPARSVALVDWADEEGARFGRSLLGSSAFAGTLDAAAVRGLGAAAGRLPGRPFSRSYGAILPSSLTMVISITLVFSTCPPVSVWGTGTCILPRGFSRRHGVGDSPAVRPAGIAPRINEPSDLPGGPSYMLTPGLPSPGIP